MCAVDIIVVQIITKRPMNDMICFKIIDANILAHVFT